MADHLAELTGALETMRLFRELPSRVAKKVLRAAVMKGGTVIVKAIRRAAPIGKTRLLKKSIARKIKTYPNGNVVAIIGASKKIHGTTRKQVPARYIHLVEKKRPFLKPTYESTKQQAAEKIKETIGEGIEREARKLR